MRIAICADLHLNNNAYGKIMDDDLPLKVHDNFAALKFFVSKCVEEKVDRVVIVGDVYDNPGPTSKIRTLFNECMQELLRAGIEVKILVGNHDTCMEHHALSPLKGWSRSLRVVGANLAEEDSELLFVYIPHSKDIETKKESFKDVIERLKTNASKKNKRIVGFGHFSVSGSMNNDSHKHFNAKDPSVADLEALGAEAFFLGHFHKRQKISDGSNIHYVGSLERQSFTEKDQNKGFCIYDTSTKELTWIDTPARKMVEISTYNYEELMGQIESLDLKDCVVKVKVLGKESDYAHIQQRFGEVSAAVMKSAMFFCGLEKPKAEEKKDAYSVEVEQTGDLDIFKILEEEIRAQSEDESEDEVSARISMLKGIKSQIDSELKMSSKSTLTGKKTIGFKRVEYHNFCRFGEVNNVIDFEKLFTDSDGIASIVGMIDMDEEESNGAGKSSLLEGLAYALYEKMPRLCSVDEKKKATTTEIIRTDDSGNYACDEAYVVLTMEIDGDEWVIKRGRKLKKNKVDHSAILEITKNGVPFNSSKNKDPNQIIVDLIGIDFEPFCNSVFFAQKDTSKIFNSTPGSRLDTILNVLGVLRDIAASLKIVREEMKKGNKEETIKTEGRISVLEASTQTTEQSIEKSIEDTGKLAEAANALVEQGKRRKQELDAEKDALVTSREGVNVEKAKVNAEVTALATKKKDEKQSHFKDKQAIEVKVREEERKLAEFNKQKGELEAEYNREIAVLKGIDLPKAQRQLKEIEEARKILPEEKRKYDDALKRRVALTSLRSKISGNADVLVAEKNKYEMILIDKSEKLVCPHCMQPQNREELQRKVSDLADQIKELKDRYDSISLQMEKIETEEETPLAERVQKLNDLIASEATPFLATTKHETATKNLESLKLKARALQESYNKSKGEPVADLKKKIADIDALVAGIDAKYAEESSALVKKLESLNSSLEGISGKLSNHEVVVAKLLKETEESSKKYHEHLGNVKVLQESLKRLLADKVELEKARADLENLRKEQLRIALLESLFGSDGIKDKVARIYLPVFNKHLGDFITILTNGRMSVSIDVDTMKPIIRGGSSSMYGMLSGGEQDVIRLASNLALGMVSLGSSRSLPETLFLDEVFGALAPAMQERVFLLLKHLRSYFKRILVITHIPSLQDRFGRIVRVEKTGGISSIKILGV